MWKFGITLILLGSFITVSDVRGDPIPSISQRAYATQSGYHIVIFDRKFVLPAANASIKGILPMDSQAAANSQSTEMAQSTERALLREGSQGMAGLPTNTLEAQLPQITGPMSGQAEAFNQTIKSFLDNRSYSCGDPLENLNNTCRQLVVGNDLEEFQSSRTQDTLPGLISIRFANTRWQNGMSQGEFFINVFNWNLSQERPFQPSDVFDPKRDWQTDFINLVELQQQTGQAPPSLCDRDGITNTSYWHINKAGIEVETQCFGTFDLQTGHLTKTAFVPWTSLTPYLKIGGLAPVSAQPKPNGPFGTPLSACQLADDCTPAYCKVATVSGVAFMQDINAILDHGNLADIAFVEKTLGTKFKLSAHFRGGDRRPGDRRPDEDDYDANEVLGNPIDIDLKIFSPSAKDLRADRLATLTIGDEEIYGRQGPDWPDFLRDCFGISKSGYSAVFGGRFFPGHRQDYETVADKIRPGPNRSTFYLSFISVGNNFTNQIVINQSAPLPHPVVGPPPAYCKATKLTGTDFLRIIQAIVANDDVLTDVAYVKKTLGVNFNAQPGLNIDGTPDFQNMTYQADGMFGTPIQIRLVNYSKVLQSENADDYIEFSSPVSSDSKSNFISDCLRIPLSTVYSYFGPEFYFSGWRGYPFEPAPPPGEMIQKSATGPGIPGKNGITLSVGVSVQAPWDEAANEDTLVTSVSIVQQH